MSLFDKLTGLAQKAKDSVVSKTLISKDRRLERSLSERIKVSDIYFEKISTYGLPSKLDVVAFDCIASLLAVGISATIKLPKSSGIKYLQFKNGYPILVVIDTKNIIITIDLRTKSIRHTLQAQQIITCHEYCTGTDWLFIGYANGYVDVFDIMQGCLSPYQIPNLIETLSDQQKGKPAANNENYNCEQRNVVVDLQIHPIDLNTLMIGYNSALFIWNIREATIRKSFTLQKLKMPVDYNINAGLTCFAWNPDGTHFVTGNDDGYVHLWDIKNEHKPVASKKVAEYFAASNKNVSNDDKHSFVGPIYQIAWYTNDKLQKSYMLIAADLEAQQIHGLTILEYDLLENSDNNNYKEVKKQTLLPLSRDLSHFLILGNDPYYLGLRNPLAVAVIDIDHSLQIYSLEHGYPRLKLPPALEFINPNVLNACYIPNISDSVFKQVTAYTMSDQKTRYLPITGGSVGPDHVYHVTSNDLLLTIHQGEIIKFWDASYTGLRPLSHLTIYSRDELTSEDAFICCVDFNKMTGTVSIGMSDGFVLIYQYHPDPEPPTNINPKFLNRRNEEFINSCDDTLEEISALLNEMQKDSSDVIERSMNNNEEQNPSDSTNPFLKTELQGAEQKDELDMKTPETTASYSSATRTSEESTTSSVSFNRIYSNPISSGYYPCLTIKLGSPVRGILSIDNSIITVTLDNGQLYLIDIMNLYSYEITRKYMNNL
ncbi:WD40-repeat-containing domain protein [Mycotypha africana]|uniref:WD40-repeat-containing domain protein n=1 Tax=Mycotypha africana TaxID=64632 RepID=UPI0023006065|nr:WD40-repeat-containing domain protein [Mycotypha africana]KAI8984675.1 WD40-repeat-containing domain protein [Mycotypha africana]